MLFTGVGVLTDAGVSSAGTCDTRVGLPWDDFKAHSCPPVKYFCKSHDFLDVEIMGGVLVPEGQLLDRAIS